MTGELPVWEQALDLLQQQKQQQAKDLLSEAENDFEAAPTTGLVDAWVNSVLHRLIISRSSGISVPNSLDVNVAPSRAHRALGVGRTLNTIIEARTAVRNGHVEELVRLANLGADNPHAEWAWIGMQVAGVLQAAFRFSGDPVIFNRAVDSCSALADRLDAPNIAIQARALLGSTYLLAGQFHRTLSYCDAAIRLSEASGLWDEPSVAMAHQFRGYVLFEWHRLDEAQASLQRAWDVTDTQHVGVRSGVARVMAALTSVLGERELSDIWMARLEDIVTEPMTLRNGEWLAAVRARHGLANHGDVRSLDAWRRTFDYYHEPLTEISDRAIGARLQEYEHLLAMLEHAGQWSALLDIAAALLRSHSTLRPWFRVKVLTARAVALDAMGKRMEAEQAYADALMLGAKGSFVRVYIDGASKRVQLLRRARRRADVREHAERIFQSVPEIAVEETDSALTSRQVQVLREVGRGISNAEIGKRLAISLPTVKSHLQNIFARLNVKSRTEAVIEGQRLGVIEN